MIILNHYMLMLLLLLLLQALCELLLYVCWVKKQFVAQDFYRLLDVLHHLTLKVKHGNAPFSVQLQATLTTVSTLLTILPPDNLQGNRKF